MRFLLVFSLVLLTADGAIAQSERQPERPWDVSLGGALLTKPEYSGSDENEVLLLPFVVAKYKLDERQSLFFNGLNGGYNYRLNDKFSAGLGARYRFGRDSDEDPVLAGMSDVDGTVEVGPFVRYNATPRLSFGISSGFDIANEHDGYALQLDTKFVTPIGGMESPWRGGLNAFLQYASEDFMNTYYGVPAAQATAARAAYNPDAGFSEVGVGGNLTYSFNDNWFARGDVGMSQLVGDAEDSPLVKEEVQWRSLLGIGYKF